MSTDITKLPFYDINGYKLIIFGANGVGKSSLAGFIANESAFDLKRIRKCRKEVEKANKLYTLDVPKPTHCVYVNDNWCFRREFHSSRKALPLYPDKLGILAEAPKGAECQFILPCSLLVIDEAQSYYPSRDGETKEPKNYKLVYPEKSRHADIDMIFTTPRAMMIDARIRRISAGLHVTKRDISIDKRGGMKIVWTVDYIPVGELDNYLSCKPAEKRKFCKKLKIVCDYNIFKIYDHKGQNRYFYEGFNKEDFKYLEKYKWVYLKEGNSS